MKKLFITLAAVYSSFLCLAAPNEKVLNNFSRSFPKAQSVQWTDTETFYEVNFNMGDVKCKLWYDAEGVVTKSIRYYLAAVLPPLIRSSVEHKYSDKKIFGVTEVTSAEGLEYHIVLEDESKWYNIVSDAVGNLQLKEKFKKA